MFIEGLAAAGRIGGDSTLLTHRKPQAWSLRQRLAAWRSGGGD